MQTFPDALGLSSVPATPLVQHKLRVPAVAERLVKRPRLEVLIGSLVASRSPVAVYATAGAGKTTAVVEALPGVGLPAAWLTVDDTDATPGRLLVYLESALATRVPGVAGVATDGLCRGVPQREATGLLAEAVGSFRLVLVIDEIERIAVSEEALGVVNALVRYAPPSLRIVLVSRRELPLDLGSSAALGQAAAIRDDDLAFTVPEAAAVLAGLGSRIDPEGAVDATGGWVAGVLFEARRSSEHVIGTGGEADPLHGYLASQVLAGLDPGEREFLIVTSLLPEVTARRADALGQARAAGLLAGLRTKRLPATWGDATPCLRCHPRFREYLRALLDRREAAEVAALHAAHAVMLEREGMHDAAADEFLAVGALEEGRRAAERAVDTVLERLDFAVVERWLTALRPSPGPGDDALTRAELMLAIARDRYLAGAELADRLVALGMLDSLVRASARTAAMMAWCYWMVGRAADAQAILDAAEDGEEMAAVSYMLALSSLGNDGSRAAPPSLTGGPLDALVLRSHYAHGRLRELIDPPPSRWAAAVSSPWRIAALRAMGRTADALELLEAGGEGQGDAAHLWLRIVVEPEVMIDLGRIDDARDSLARGRELIRDRGDVMHGVFHRLVEAKYHLRLTGDLERAEAELEQVEGRPELARYPFLIEHVATWSGMLLLLQHRDNAATRRLRQAVRGMKAADRILELPTAAVLLSEAEWRVGRADAARKAADLALGAAACQGSNHVLMQALVDFPAVATRRIDAEPRADSPWHEIGRALFARAAPPLGGGRSRIRLAEFGQPVIEVNGAEVRPRIRKSYELLAYLAGRVDHEAERDELLDALFGGRADDSTRSYLRQAVHRLREVLPADAVLAFEGSRLRLAGDLELVSDCARVDHLLARAGHQRDHERLELLLEALTLLDRGEYLSGISSTWVDERRQQLVGVAADARHEAAQLLFAEARYAEARGLASEVLRTDPYRETAWRLLMRLANATGDEDGVITAYRLCERALTGIGAAPSPTTKSLLTSLRR